MTSGLPGVGIFGSDPISKVLIKFLRHFDFEIHAIWTNNIDFANLNAYKSHLEDEKIDPSKLTNSIDSVLLNKNGMFSYFIFKDYVRTRNTKIYFYF